MSKEKTDMTEKRRQYLSKRAERQRYSHRTGLRRISYVTALPGGKQWARYITEGIGIAAVIDELFYREAAAMFPLLSFSFLWVLYREKEWRRKRQEQLVLDFREALGAFAVSLRSGISVENAIPEVYQALNRTIGKERDMTKEFAIMMTDLRVGIPAERLFRDLAERSGSEEIRDFSMVFSTAKRMGGNLSKMIRKTADQIGAGIETKQDIQTILAAKKLEQKIMSLMPFGIIAYLQLTSPGYLSGLYHCAFGVAFMSICLILWLMATIWGNSMIRIDV